MPRTEPTAPPGNPLTALGGHARLFLAMVGLAIGVLGWALVEAAWSAPAPTVSVATASGFGNILVDAQGLPLYTLGTDHGGQSTCTGSCLQIWPPLNVTPGTTPSAGSGVPGTLGATTQSDGRDQVTYNGMPLYTFVGDSPGNVTGQGQQGFTVVQVTPTSASATTTTAAGPAAPTTVASAAASGNPQPGAAATGGTPASASANPTSGTPATAPSAATPAASATAPGSATAAQSSGTLAATGPGSGLRVLSLVGLLLVVVGAATSLGVRLRGASR